MKNVDLRQQIRENLTSIEKASFALRRARQVIADCERDLDSFRYRQRSLELKYDEQLVEELRYEPREHNT